MKKITIIFVLAAVLALSGCATILCKSTQNVAVDSNPNKASVRVEAISNSMINFKGKTPTTFTLPRDNKYKVTISLDGYQDEEVFIDQQFNPVFLGNVICGGLIGMIIDFASGAFWNLSPGQIRVDLRTASIEGEKDDVLYAVVATMNENNQPQTLVIPMIPE